MNRLLLGYDPDFDLFDDVTPIVTPSPEPEGPARELDHAAAATALLEASGPAALPAVLARLLQRAARAAGGTIDRALERELIGLLQRAARVALPEPCAFASPGGCAARASRFFGIELEGLSPEDQEFESARRFIQLVHAVAGQALRAPSRLRPAFAARLVAARAARRFAPGWSAALNTPSVTAGRSRPLFIQGAHHA